MFLWENHGKIIYKMQDFPATFDDFPPPVEQPDPPRSWWNAIEIERSQQAIVPAQTATVPRCHEKGTFK
jgi:hypothetical protein